ncbi:FAS1 domain-containing protein [Xylaria intraflava]|nr:FAS1 domain-containing protein [Xylaria intraflava]
MRYANLLPLAAVMATAIVIPDYETAQQLALEVKKPVDETALDWWHGLRSTVEETANAISKGTQKLIDEVSEASLLEILIDTDQSDGIFSAENFDTNVNNPYHNRKLNLTIYEAIQESKHSRKFAALVEDFPDIVQMLNSTDANVTVLVPADRAFKKIPKNHKELPKEFLKKIIEYHIVPGNCSIRQLFASHTLPTALKGEALGGRPQRLRVSISLLRLRINFYSKVIFGNMYAKNGVIHAVDSILVPPPPARRIISLFPSMFSTLELAAKKTGLLPHHGDGEHGSGLHNSTGLTLFAPTNLAFRKLGPAANAFLFNTEQGIRCLRALLKYHMVANETLYSDEFYGLKDPREDADGNGRFHVDLPTLLGKETLSVDVARWYRFVNMRVNGYTNVAIEDGIARNGVVQVVNSVLIPPHGPKRGAAWVEADEEISVDELTERLAPYMGNEDGEEKVEPSDDAGEDELWGEL